MAAWWFPQRGCAVLYAAAVSIICSDHGDWLVGSRSGAKVLGLPTAPPCSPALLALTTASFTRPAGRRHYPTQWGGTAGAQGDKYFADKPASRVLAPVLLLGKHCAAFDPGARQASAFRPDSADTVGVLWAPVRRLLLFDVLADDLDGRTAETANKMGRRPQGAAQTFLRKFFGYPERLDTPFTSAETATLGG